MERKREARKLFDDEKGKGGRGGKTRHKGKKKKKGGRANVRGRYRWIRIKEGNKDGRGK